MNERKGVVFSIHEDNLPIEGCTISKEVVNEPDYHLFYFSLAAHTDISPETYQKAKVIYVLSGSLSLYGEVGDREVPSWQGTSSAREKSFPVSIFIRDSSSIVIST